MAAGCSGWHSGSVSKRARRATGWGADVRVDPRVAQPRQLGNGETALGAPLRSLIAEGFPNSGRGTYKLELRACGCWLTIVNCVQTQQLRLQRQPRTQIN